MELEGTLRIDLGVAAGRVARVGIASTRPDVARTLLQGRSRTDIGATLPRLFSVCSRSQAAAGELACAVAAGEPATADVLARCRAEVSAEVIREYAWHVLLEWPRRIGEEPAAAAIAAARNAEAAQARATTPADGDAQAIAMAAFGVGADEWLSIGARRELDRWVDAGATAAARFVCSMREAEAIGAGGPERGHVDVALLGSGDRSAAMVALWSACETDPDFPRRPTSHGLPAETGALARLQADPLIGELTRDRAGRVVARFVARLRELAWLLAGRDSVAVGVQAFPPGGASAWVENARGLLVHQVRLEGERATAYRIVAPTEWNFHPDGAVAAALAGSPAADREALHQRALRVVHSLDPCVACRVEIEDA